MAYKTTVRHRAEIVVAKLEEFEINAVIVNKKDSNYHFGTFEVYVPQDLVLKAIQCIEKEVKFE